MQGYYEHFHYLNNYLGGDVPNEEVTVDLFRNYIGYMLNDQGLKPTTVNVLFSPTLHSFLLFSFIRI
ncbi:hypothetical protein [Neobacillus drentensis]|uniref:hypothetical protein n=1 Tax=Neobacillus drentensis TaxID=220684 RepID=UPI003B587578